MNKPTNKLKAALTKVNRSLKTGALFIWKTIKGSQLYNTLILLYIVQAVLLVKILISILLIDLTSGDWYFEVLKIASLFGLLLLSGAVSNQNKTKAGKE